MPVFNSQQAPDIFDTRPLWLTFLAFKQNKKSFTRIFEVKKASDAHIDLARFSGQGRFHEKAEGTPVRYDIPVQGMRRRVTHSTYALGTAMTHEAVSDAKFEVLDRQVEALNRSLLDHQERLAWAMIDDLTDGAIHTGIDGLSIINTAHTMLKPPTPGQTLSNQLVPFMPLSIEALESAVIVLKTQLSEEGHQIGEANTPRILRIPTELIHVAKTILQAQGRPGTTNTFDPNTISDYGLEPVDTPYTTDEQAWEVMAAKGADSAGFVWNDREAPRMSNSTDADTGDRKWRQWYRASVMNRQWQGIVGTAP